MAHDKFIKVGVGAGEFDEFDDKRHGERATFQEVGIDLFRFWFKHGVPVSGEPPTLDRRKAKTAVKKAVKKEKDRELSKEELDFVVNLVELIPLGKEGADLKRRILKLAQVSVVPPGGSEAVVESVKLLLDSSALSEVK